MSVLISSCHPTGLSKIDFKLSQVQATNIIIKPFRLNWPETVGAQLQKPL
ncbi:hypothetical protein COMA1_40144 [Candidatus Nitrospira nitrosa]|uniref:Uncharacterized protein n=1 Tax=Candidatus Nitrospira nitrosa TaxID=1742972 RepID=A0A0S4LNU5_9BACT|nr:hypothetical protein COMA1_40144 [Candidatus Nitrospira nitrosa]